jgi:hypothetical protein
LAIHEGKIAADAVEYKIKYKDSTHQKVGAVFVVGFHEVK